MQLTLPCHNTWILDLLLKQVQDLVNPGFVCVSHLLYSMDLGLGHKGICESALKILKVLAYLVGSGTTGLHTQTPSLCCPACVPLLPHTQPPQHLSKVQLQGKVLEKHNMLFTHTTLWLVVELMVCANYQEIADHFIYTMTALTLCQYAP
jgi:hypothetical protein